MAILGTLLKKGIRLREMLEQEYTSPFDLQKKGTQGIADHSKSNRIW
jgi:hypothetical protein